MSCNNLSIRKCWWVSLAEIKWTLRNNEQTPIQIQTTMSPRNVQLLRIPSLLLLGRIRLWNGQVLKFLAFWINWWNNMVLELFVLTNLLLIWWCRVLVNLNQIYFWRLEVLRWYLKCRETIILQSVFKTVIKVDNFLLLALFFLGFLISDHWQP